MKHVILQRAWSTQKATMGMIRVVEDEHMPIFTLENPLRPTEVDSRIPPGNYDCVPYSSEKHSKAWLVKDVPGRTHILIHSGNCEKDTLGCILVGLLAETKQGEPWLEQSKLAIEKLEMILGSEDFRLSVVEERNFCE